MRSIALISAALLAATSCATEATVVQVRGPSGGAAYDIECHGGGRAVCYERAGQICPNGYQLVDAASSTRGAVVYGGSVRFKNEDEILIECKTKNPDEEGHALSCLTEPDGGKTCHLEDLH